MARATKVKPTRRARPSQKTSSNSMIPDVGELFQPSTDLKDYCFLIYGEKSMGKTTLLSQVSELGVVAMFEDRENLPIRMLKFSSQSVTNLENGASDPWVEFKRFRDEAFEDDRVDFIGVDTIDMAYAACKNHICAEEGIRDPGEVNDFGTTWNLISEEFRSTMESIRKHPNVGLAFTSHCSIERMELNTASKEELKKYTVYSPSAGKQPTDYVRKFADYVFFYGKHGRNRGLHIRWEDNIWTACGNDNHFLTESGEQIAVLDMPSKLTAGKCFTSAFNNQPISIPLKLWEDEGQTDGEPPPSQERRPARKKRKVSRS